MNLIPTPSDSHADEVQALKALTALAHAQRLRIFKALVVAGHDGVTPSVLAEHLSSTASGLSFHLKELANAGLVDSEQRGRNLIYRANFTRMNGMLAYLTAHCCQGSACEVTVSAAPCTHC